MRIAINRTLRVYVIPTKHGRRDGFTCLGFSVAFDKATAVARWLAGCGVDVEFPRETSIGRVRGYREFTAVVLAARKHFKNTGERCSVKLTKELVGFEGSRVEIIDSEGDKRRFWVGKSTGWIPCHIELARRDSSGGFPVYGAPFQSLTVIERNGRR
ncbi:MAG: hypothetical protein ABL984_03165 [Pyrinomonadaceae bacterium]